jgi:CheY-like chemotaxis protein
MLQRILLIDDSEGEALFVKRMLRDAGLEEPIYSIHDSEEAIRYLSGESEYSNRQKFPFPDIILLDLGMPKIDGYQVLRWLRGQPELARTLVIVLTAEMDPKRIQLAYQLGATSFLAKNSSMEEFRNFVEFFRGFSRVANILPRAVTALPETTVLDAIVNPNPPPDPGANAVA